MDSWLPRGAGGWNCKNLLSLDKYIDEGLKSDSGSNKYKKFERTLNIFMASEINPKDTSWGWGRKAHDLFDEFKKRYIHKFIAHTYNEDYIEHFDNLYDFYKNVFDPIHKAYINNYYSPGFKIYKELKDEEKNYLPMFIKFTKNTRLHRATPAPSVKKYYHNQIPEGDFGWVFTLLFPENYKDKDFEAYVLDSENPSFKKFDRIEGFGKKEEDTFTYKQIFHNTDLHPKNKRLFWIRIFYSLDPKLLKAAKEAYTNLLKGYRASTLNLWQISYLPETFIEKPARSIYAEQPNKKNAFIAELRNIMSEYPIVKLQEEKNKTYNIVIFDTKKEQIGFKHNSKNIYIPYDSWNDFIVKEKGEEEGEIYICENDKCIELNNYKTENLPQILESIKGEGAGGLNFLKLEEFLKNSKFFEKNAEENTADSRFHKTFLYINPTEYFNNINLRNRMKLEQKESKLALTFAADFVSDEIDYYDLFSAADKVEGLIQELRKVSEDSLKSKIITHYLENYKPSGSTIYGYIDNVVLFFKNVYELENEKIKKNLVEQLSVIIEKILKSPQEFFEKIGLILTWNEKHPANDNDKIVLYEILSKKYWDNFIEQIDSFYKNELSKQRAEEEKQRNIAQTTSAMTMQEVHEQKLKTAKAEREYNIAAQAASEAAENAAKAAEKASEAEAKSKIAAREVEELDTALSEAKSAKIQARIQELEKEKQEAETRAAKAAAAAAAAAAKAAGKFATEAAPRAATQEGAHRLLARRDCSDGARGLLLQLHRRKQPEPRHSRVMVGHVSPEAGG